MGYLIIILICAIIGAMMTWYDELSILGFIAGAIIGIIVTVIVGSIIFGCNKEVEIKTASQPIYALDNGSGVNGAFFLGSGVVDKTEKYTYLVNTDKGMQIKTVDVSSAYVKEDNSQKPKRITYTTDFASPFLRFWFPDIGSDETYQFIIPKGSVKYNYNVDVSK